MLDELFSCLYFTKGDVEIQFAMFNVPVHLQFIPNETTYACSVDKVHQENININPNKWWNNNAIYG